MPNKEKYNDALHRFDDNWNMDNLFEEYLQFSRFMQALFISEDGYIIDTGNFQTVNYEMMYRIKEKVERHPLLWTLLFMIA